MGTNFYWRRGGEHIGKRSAAGWYCYDCRVALVEGGEQNAHSSTAQRLDACPVCGKTKEVQENLDASADITKGRYNPVMIELGFARAPTKPTKLTGVQGASSFTWAQEPAYVAARCKGSADKWVVQDEYGRDLTGAQFIDMLESVCPIRFTHSIGHDFS